MLTDTAIRNLEEIARKLRCDIIRMITEAGSGHPGGSLSVTDIITYLYFHRMRIDASNSRWEDRDRFVLSKGHCCPALYAALAEKGFFSAEELMHLRDIGSILQGHPDMNKTPGVDMTTGSLAQGISCAAGMALGAKLRKKDLNVYVIIGDGESQEGQVWEAAMAAGHYKLDNLYAIVDFNRLQIDGKVEEIMNINPYMKKWEAFGWEVATADGHSFAALDMAFERFGGKNGEPKVIVAHTVKGKGVSFMENDPSWHGVPPSVEQACKAIKEIRGDIA